VNHDVSPVSALTAEGTENISKLEVVSARIWQKNIVNAHILEV
jgi:hypothetical protein